MNLPDHMQLTTADTFTLTPQQALRVLENSLREAAAESGGQMSPNEYASLDRLWSYIQGEG